MIAVYRFPNRTDTVFRSALVCHLRDITVTDAIAKLQRCGVLAIPGPDVDSIVLAGYHYETMALMDDLRIYGSPHTPATQFRYGWIRRLAASV